MVVRGIAAVIGFGAALFIPPNTVQRTAAAGNAGPEAGGRKPGLTT